MSGVFNVLAVNERLKVNMTGQQIADTLDDFIYAAIYEFRKITPLVNRGLVEIFPYAFTNGRRKISALEKKEDFIRYLFLAVSSKSYKDFYKYLRKAYIERTILFNLLDYLFLQVKGFTTACETLSFSENDKESKQIVMRTERKLEVKDKNKQRMYRHIRQGLYYRECAHTFKQMIMEKYIRYAYKQASFEKSKTGLNVDKYSIFSSMMLGISKGIDKFYPKGAITSYLSLWMIEAATGRSHEYGVAYDIPTAQRKAHLESNNFNFSENSDNYEFTDDENPEKYLNEQQGSGILARLAFVLDKHRVASIVNGFLPPLTQTELALLESTITEPTKVFGQDRHFGTSRIKRL